MNENNSLAIPKNNSVSLLIKPLVSRKINRDHAKKTQRPMVEKVFKELLPELRKKWHKRNNRPMPQSIQFALSKFEKVWIADSSVLESLFKKLKSLEDIPKGKLAGKMGVVIDLMTRLPVDIWFQENPNANDVNFEKDILNLAHSRTLLLLDRGFYHFLFWLQLIENNIHFITRLKKRATIQIEQVFTDSYSLRERLLGLSYLWTGSINGVQLQIWGTWLFYSVLVDLGDAVADELSLPIDSISLEMIYRGLYHFYVAHQKGLTSEPIAYFADPKNRDLGIVKQKRTSQVKLIVAPFPERMRGEPGFFFQSNSKSLLTSRIQA
jgi:hypothetical protein